MIRLAYFGIPHSGGTHTVYRSLRSGLAAHGVEVRWLGSGARHARMMADARWAPESDQGEVITPGVADEVQIGRALKRYLESGRYDGVIVNVLADRVQTNVVRYLKPELARVMVVHNITPGTYAAARTVRDWAHATVGVSPRVRDDLVARHGFDPVRTDCIPNAVDLTAYGALAPSSRPAPPPLRLLSLGRLEDRSKGIFWLVDILECLRGLDVRLTIVGDGPDRAELERRFANLAERVQFLGAVMPNEVPAVYARNHVFVMPSRFEGFGQTIIEAMAAGCVPVVSRIRGVTDTIVTHGRDGLLFRVGSPDAAASAVHTLASNPALLEVMSQRARANVRGRFTVERIAEAYAQAWQRVLAAPPAIAAPLPIERWFYPRGLRAGLRTYLPDGMKNRLRVLRERFAA